MLLAVLIFDEVIYFLKGRIFQFGMFFTSVLMKTLIYVVIFPLNTIDCVVFAILITIVGVNYKE